MSNGHKGLSNLLQYEILVPQFNLPSFSLENRALCKACRYEICLKMGMATSLVQMPKENDTKQRSYYTKSGLKRNKRFSCIKLPIDTPPSSTDKESNNENECSKSMESPDIKLENGNGNNSIRSNEFQCFRGQIF